MKDIGPLWHPCKLSERKKQALEAATECYAEDGYYKQLECLKKIAGSAGLKYLGAGMHRAGFSTNSCVVKLALNGEEGERANKGEAESWNIIGRRFSNVFAPVHDHAKDYEWITTPKLVPINKFPDNIRVGYQRKLKNKMENKAIDCEDLHTGNIGLKPGTRDVYLYDYGFGLSCKVKSRDGTEKELTVKGAVF